MSNFIQYEQEETSDWKERQSAFSTNERRGGEDYAADVIQRGHSGFTSKLGSAHPEHMADFRRFQFTGKGSKKQLFVPRFDVYVATTEDLKTRYTQLIPKIKEGGDSLRHAMYVNDIPVGTSVEGDKLIYLCLKGYNESLEQYTVNRADRSGRPWFIVEDAWLEITEDEQSDEHGDPGAEDLKKYVLIGTVNTKSGFCETYIGQEMYLFYEAPNIPEDGGFDLTNMLTPWWKPTLSQDNKSVRVENGLNFIPSKVGYDIMPLMQWKREFCWKGGEGKVVKLGKKTTYFWVKCEMEFNNADQDPQGYLVADKMVHEPDDDHSASDPEVGGNIRNFFHVSKANNGTFNADANYSLFTSFVPTQPEDTQLTKYQYLGSITKGAFGIKHWEWRLNHAFYWNHMGLPVGSFGATSGELGSVSNEAGLTFVPGKVKRPS